MLFGPRPDIDSLNGMPASNRVQDPFGCVIAKTLTKLIAVLEHLVRWHPRG